MGGIVGCVLGSLRSWFAVVLGSLRSWVRCVLGSLRSWLAVLVVRCVLCLLRASACIVSAFSRAAVPATSRTAISAYRYSCIHRICLFLSAPMLFCFVVIPKTVIPAKAGSALLRRSRISSAFRARTLEVLQGQSHWIPAFAGMTIWKEDAGVSGYSATPK